MKKNQCDIRDISYSSNGFDKKGYWFKCPRGIHPSELQNINDFVHNTNGLSCNQCNSFAQWGIDNICEDFLEKYWDYEENDKLSINPWEVAYGSDKKVFIFCQEKDYHRSYDVRCANFTFRQSRCPYCNSFASHGKVHSKDSLGQYIIDNYGQAFLSKVWSEKNKKSPFEYTPSSRIEVWWKCPDGKHEDYYRNIDTSKRMCNFRCPECGFSKGEKRVENWLVKNNINYTPQKKFYGLLGLGRGNLSYDFYLLQHNILIEYDGEMHFSFVKGVHQSEKDFEKQVEHDRRKDLYAKNNNIKLIRIPYWDFDNIEKILDEEVKEIK